MADETKSDKPTNQVYKLTKVETGRRGVAKAFGGYVGDASNLPDGVIASNAALPEDEFQTYYVGGANDRGVIPPPYNMRQLEMLVQENNTLGPCIEAMVTNVDGTGYDFASKDESAENDEDDDNIIQLREFFEQPSPDMNFITLRKKLRRDLEQTGNAYIEVLRNPQDEIVALVHVEAKMMRLVQLDAPVVASVKMRRGGKDVVVKMARRERRYVQLLNGVNLIYYKDFGGSRDVNKTTGAWSAQGARLPAKDRGTEILHFTCLRDATTPYGVPRWISQLPSILGSRKAEEFNLEYFDNGGIPPVLITLQGGTLQAETRKALDAITHGNASKLNRVQILEVEPIGGSVDHPTQARVTVERFGGDRQSDAMFLEYDQKCEENVRRSFRISPLFIGQANDANFATAFISYTVTEAQVFKPERDEFDEIITNKLLPAMGFGDYKIKSNPITIQDSGSKLDGLQVAISTNSVDMEDVIYEINMATGLNLKVSENPPPTKEPQMTVDADGNIVPMVQPRGMPTGSTPEVNDETVKPATAKVAKFEQQPAGVYALAKDTMIALRKRDFPQVAKNMAFVQSLDATGVSRFRKALAELQFINPDHDAEGLGELMSCTVSAMHKNCNHVH